MTSTIRRFPALDPEPPPRSWRFRIVATLAVVAGLAGATVGAVALASTVGKPGPSRAPVSVSTGSSGRILALTAAGQLELSPVNRAAATVLPDLGKFTQTGREATSPDGTLVVMGDGTVLSVHGDHVAVADHVRIAGGTAISYVSPFANHDQALVTTQVVKSGPGEVFAVPIAGGPSVRLGQGEGVVAGDPQQLGAFVAQPLGASVSNQAVSNLPLTGAVVLDDAGQPPRVLVTAAQVNVDLRQTASAPITMIPYPDPQGGKVAIAVIPSASAAIGGIVVVDRTGRLLDWTAVFTGTNGLAPSWSPNGTALAFADQSASAGYELTLWTPNTVAGQQAVDNTTTTLFPDSPTGAGTCFWSPDGQQVMCQTFGSQTGTVWESTLVGSTAIESLAAPGIAIGWVGG